jgi:hypothetical protein
MLITFIENSRIYKLKIRLKLDTNISRDYASQNVYSIIQL